MGEPVLEEGLGVGSVARRRRESAEAEAER